MAPHSSTVAWKIPWTEEPGGLQSMGSRRVGHDWGTSLSLFTFMHRRRKWQPTPVFLPGESQGWGSLVSAVSGVAQSRTWLKWLSSSSSRAIMKMLVGEGWRTAFHREKGSMEALPLWTGSKGSNYHSNARGPWGESIGPVLPVNWLPKLIRSVSELFSELLSTSSQ